uniref:Uncharacterized protein n=1 Tax=Eucampia antarctica TaxID=49252 RepID=A0A7S2WIA3_9STRA|mmetsp:Transcript_30569/g.29478  ORF Transcript_30569/g.29478 Transcript_30569/m.29478 type:complete len:300 (+) Transcript_30569:69-968(+)|eukprot:CAMPEP_0197837326 /NCGR_PEP_ID=MMETSP1437-20131217/31818_1 /TAXON_ID=49252 ORGANISM="Eucampia antarctica, Strain CCMP1452" /NCGR_SAMPLE_ID=MMETSP1437 /ASSEMBLY_ACC=CAM_ASM_001096 /LENGTH=299 /DNA_ID=CAMNT_0043444291 /DNA_START=66 /DNA_END=965 /DNA_ORIENTATION=+
MGKQSKAKASTESSRTQKDVVVEPTISSATVTDKPKPRISLSGAQMTTLAFLTVTITGLSQASRGDSYFPETQQPQGEVNLAMLQMYNKVGIWSTSWAVMSILLLWYSDKAMLQTYNIVCAMSPVSTTYIFHTLNPDVLPNSKNIQIALLAVVSFSSATGYAPLAKVSFLDTYNLVLFTLSNIIMTSVAAIAIFGFIPESMDNLDDVGNALWRKTFAVYGTSMALTVTFALLWMDAISKRVLLLFMACSTIWFAQSSSVNLPHWITKYDNTFYDVLLGGTMIMLLGCMNPNFLKRKTKQ